MSKSPAVARRSHGASPDIPSRIELSFMFRNFELEVVVLRAEGLDVPAGGIADDTSSYYMYISYN